MGYEALCREKLKEALKGYGHNDDTEPRNSYLTKVFSAAEHYGVPVLDEIEFEINGNHYDMSMRRLFQTIYREVTKFRLQTIRERKGTAVIEPPQVAKIEHLVSQLRQRVTDSTDMDERTKQKVCKKLDELLGIMRGGKPTLQATMVVIASIFTAINQGQAAIIKLPETISAIAEIFGHAQEDADLKALEHEDHSEDSYETGFTTKPKPTGPKETYHLNDDIPF